MSITIIEHTRKQVTIKATFERPGLTPVEYTLNRVRSSDGERWICLQRHGSVTMQINSTEFGDTYEQVARDIGHMLIAIADNPCLITEADDTVSVYVHD